MKKKAFLAASLAALGLAATYQPAGENMESDQRTQEKVLRTQRGIIENNLAHKKAPRPAIPNRAKSQTYQLLKQIGGGAYIEPLGQGIPPHIYGRYLLMSGKNKYNDRKAKRLFKA